MDKLSVILEECGEDKHIYIKFPEAEWTFVEGTYEIIKRCINFKAMDLYTAVIIVNNESTLEVELW